MFKNDSGSTAALAFSWKNQLRHHSYFGNSIRLRPDSTPTRRLLHSNRLLQRWPEHFFRLQLRSCSKIFESGSGYGPRNFFNLRIRLLFRFRRQAKFLTWEISDVSPCAHTQSNILRIKYAEKTDDYGQWQRWADCEIFQSESSLDPIKLNLIKSWSAKFFKIISPIQSWPAHVKSWIFILHHQAKAPLKLFYLQCHMIGWRQSSTSRACASWGKIDIAFWHFQNFIRQCLLCLMKQKNCWSCFAIRRIRLFGLVKWQRRYRIDLDQHKVLVTWPKTPNPKPKPKT